MRHSEKSNVGSDRDSKYHFFLLHKSFFNNLQLSFIFTDEAGGPTAFVLGSTLGGVFIGLLVLLLIFVLYLRQRRNTGFEPLIKADFTNRKYTEEA